jgi:uncharacterized membrane protein YheB (UPF0754 family)
MNKSIIKNLIAVTITIYGLVSPIFSTEIFMAGLFALSGGLTNWLAIHMLFEKVPLLYGSGVIPNRFEDFKNGIKNLIMNEFFSSIILEKFLKNKADKTGGDILKSLDYDKIFIKLVEAIEESSLGSMLNMLGGKKALDPLKEPVKKKIKELFNDISLKQNDENFNPSEKLKEDIENIIDKRLEELTPEHIKIIMKEMIQKHLGWLVVWGGVFGFLIGLLLGILGSLN